MVTELAADSGEDAALRMSRDELAALQLRRLQWSVRHAYDNIALYRAKCEARDVHPDHLREHADLARFPFMEKEDFRIGYPFGMLAVPREAVVRIHASSGTTGRPTVVGYTQNDVDMWSGLVARSIRAAGGKRGDIVHIAYGYGLFTGGLGAHYGAERLGCTVIPMSGGQTERQVQLIVDLKPDIIMVTPSYMLAIADEFERQGLDPRRSSLRVGIHGAEPWTNSMRAEIEQRLDMHAIDIYGLSEVLGPGVASEFVETKDGATVWEDHFYPEIVDPESGEAVPDGESGELVFTSLTKEALPVIRYRTRDRTRLLPGSMCAMRRMERIAGRTDDMMIVRGVNVFPTQIEEQILKEPRLAPHYLLELSRPGHLDELKVLVEMRAEIVAASAPGADEHHQIRGELQHRIKTFIGVTAEIEIVPCGTVERSIGKAKRVVDKRHRKA